MQCSLIDEGTAQHRVIVSVVADREPPEPLGPLLIEVPLDANFIRVHHASFLTCLCVVFSIPLTIMIRNFEPNYAACLGGSRGTHSSVGFASSRREVESAPLKRYAPNAISQMTMG